MKRLNRKGFTLVELLAVIVILAIVVGIALTTVLPTLKKSRQSAFELTAQTAEDFLEKEYQLYVIGETSTIPSDILTSFKGLTFTGTPAKSANVNFTKTSISEAGLKPGNYISGTWYIIQSSGRVCVQLVAATNDNANTNNLNGQKAAGEYYDVNKGNATPYYSTKSSGCN